MAVATQGARCTVGQYKPDPESRIPAFECLAEDVYRSATWTCETELLWVPILRLSPVCFVRASGMLYAGPDRPSASLQETLDYPVKWIQR